jgi:hypothetical protein
MTTLTKEQVEQKMQQLKQLAEEVNVLTKELAEAGAIELSEEDLDKVAGGRPVYEIVGEKGSCTQPDTRRVIKTLLPDPKVGEEPKAILPPGM